MTYKQFATIAFHIILLFVGAMMYTFFTEFLQSSGFFGDAVCATKDCGEIDESYIWGIRHYFYFWMSFSLFVLNIIRIGILIDQIINEKDKNK